MAHRHCLNCSPHCQLILQNNIQIVATRCQILRLKCTHFDFGWGSTPDPAGDFTALPRPAEFKRPSKRRGRMGERGGEGREGKKRVGMGERKRGHTGTSYFSTSSPGHVS